MVASNGESKTNGNNARLQCGANYTELFGLDLKIVWGRTVYMNVWLINEVNNENNEKNKNIIDYGDGISSKMIAKFTEIS